MRELTDAERIDLMDAAMELQETLTSDELDQLERDILKGKV